MSCCLYHAEMIRKCLKFSSSFNSFTIIFPPDISIQSATPSFEFYVLFIFRYHMFSAVHCYLNDQLSTLSEPILRLGISNGETVSLFTDMSVCFKVYSLAKIYIHIPIYLLRYTDQLNVSFHHIHSLKRSRPF